MHKHRRLPLLKSFSKFLKFFLKIVLTRGVALYIMKKNKTFHFSLRLNDRYIKWQEKQL